MGNPGDLGSETLNVVLLTLQDILGNEERERAVLHADALIYGQLQFRSGIIIIVYLDSSC
jgi:hypothetical protein